MPSKLLDNSQLRYKDVVEFVLENRGPDSFTQMDHSLLFTYILQHSEQGTLQTITRKNPYRLCGVVVYSLCPDKGIYVQNIVISEPGILREFINLFKQLFPGYYINAHRHGKPIKYDFFRTSSK